MGLILVACSFNTGNTQLDTVIWLIITAAGQIISAIGGFVEEELFNIIIAISGIN
jgi:hypothetical protein